MRDMLIAHGGLILILILILTPPFLDLLLCLCFDALCSILRGEGDDERGLYLALELGLVLLDVR